MNSREVELLAVMLEDARDLESPAASLLEPSERLDFEQSSNIAVRSRRIVARAITRILLGRRLGVAPQEIRFEHGLHGKPYLVRHQGAQFNLSHSGDLLLFAFAFETEIGADVEQLRPRPRAIELAGHYFSREEAYAIRQAFSPDHAFLTLWTRKEAYLKATGCGLAGDLKSVRFSSPHNSDCPSWIGGDDPFCWSVHTFQPLPGYVASVAFRNKSLHLALCAILHARPLLSSADEASAHLAAVSA
jgi:4'-phosphopantetheinyl transferase